MAVTSTKPDQTSEVRGIAERLASDADALGKGVEEILWQYDSEEEIDPRDAEVLRVAGLTNPNEVVAERSRIRAVKNHMSQAGSHREYADAKQSAAAAADRLRELRPGIEEQIRTLERQLKDLESDSQAAAGKLAGYDSARAALRNDRMLPRFIRDRLAYERRVAGQGLKKPIAELQSKLAMIDGVMKLEPDSEQALWHLQGYGRKEPSLQKLVRRKIERNVVSYEVDAAGFMMHQQQLEMERPELEQKLQDLQAEYEKRLAQSRAADEFYINKLPN